MFLPFSWLPYTKAYLAWTVCSMASLWLVLLVLWKLLPVLHREFEVVALVCGLSFPVIGCLCDGQNSILLLLLLSLSFSSLARRRSVACGVFLALGLFKFHLVLPILAVLLLAHTWRILRGFCYGMLVLLVVSFAVDGIHGTLPYFTFLLRYGHESSATGSTKNIVMPNIRGFVSFVTGPLNHVEAQLVAVAAISIALFLAVLAWQWKFKNTSAALQFSAAIVVTSLVSYVYFPYNAVILVLPFLLMANEVATGEYTPKLRRAFTMLTSVTCATVILGNVFVYTAVVLLTIESLALLGIILAAPYDRRKVIERASACPPEITVPANA